ncbi:MAG: hypothetical protein LBC94_09075 [Desulfovibrio sp.]|jgi:hypothetical protein|nr:hypothetical protein [Desulfovibrio sp.]
MELTGITQSMSFLFRFPDRGNGGSMPPAAQDTVNVSAPPLLGDDQVQGVFNDTLDMIATNNVAAFVHDGLTPERVFALLGA